MENNRLEISVRVKGAREASDISIQGAAEFLGIDAKTYQAFESGEIDIPMGNIPQLAELFHVDPSVILTGRNSHSRVFTVTRKDKGSVVERGHAYHYESLNSGFANAVMMPYLVTVESPEDGQEMHLNTHPGDEFNRVISGRMELVVDGNSIILETGDSIYFDATKPHAMRALDGKPAQFLAVITTA